MFTTNERLAFCSRSLLKVRVARGGLVVGTSAKILRWRPPSFIYERVVVALRRS